MLTWSKIAGNPQFKKKIEKGYTWAPYRGGGGWVPFGSPLLKPLLKHPLLTPDTPLVSN